MSHRPEEAPFLTPVSNASDSSRTQHRVRANKVKATRYEPAIEQAMEGVKFIVQHLKDENMDQRVGHR